MHYSNIVLCKISSGICLISCSTSRSWFGLVSVPVQGRELHRIQIKLSTLLGIPWKKIFLYCEGRTHWHCTSHVPNQIKWLLTLRLTNHSSQADYKNGVTVTSSWFLIIIPAVCPYVVIRSNGRVIGRHCIPCH